MTVKNAGATSPKGAGPAPTRPALRKRQAPYAAHLVLDAAPTGQGGDVRAFRSALRFAQLSDRISLEREGVPAIIVRDLITRLGITDKTFQMAAGIPKATFSKKIQARATFSGTPGQAVVGMMDLINVVEDMVRRDPAAGAENFDAESWVGEWVQQPIPALGGQRPIDLMDTPAGREAVMQVIEADREGVFL